jgi:hypothetical protein
MVGTVHMTRKKNNEEGMGQEKRKREEKEQRGTSIEETTWRK